MKILNMALMVLAFGTAVIAQAEIREIQNMQEALSVAQPGDLVVFDLDNTVIEPDQTLGADQWYKDRLSGYVAKGISSDEAMIMAAHDFVTVQKQTGVQTVEDNEASQINALIAKGIATVALTARPTVLAKTTLKQLRRLNIQLNSFSYKFSADDVTAKVPVLVDHNVILVGPQNNKGLIFHAMITHMKNPPKRILFVDDTRKNIDDMDAAFTQSGITNINFRYGYLDQWVKDYDHAIATTEWSYFRQYHEIISDYDACAIESRCSRGVVP